LRDRPALLDRAVREGLADPRPGGVANPRTYRARYALVERAAAIDEEAAAYACSWGWGQVMGANYPLLGLDSARDVRALAEQSVEGQSALVFGFVDGRGLTPYLNALPDREAATKFARAYNGPAHARNRYVPGLIDAWKRVGETRLGEVVDPQRVPPPEDRSTRALQRALGGLGYYEGATDGIKGPATTAALRDFQRDNGLVVDGIPGPMSWAALDEATRARARARERERAPERAGKAAGTVAAGGGLVAVAAEQVNGLAYAVTTVRDGLAEVLDAVGVNPGSAGYVLGGVAALLLGYAVYAAVRRFL